MVFKISVQNKKKHNSMKARVVFIQDYYLKLKIRKVFDTTTTT